MINVRNKGAGGEREVAAILQKVVDEVFAKCGHEPPKLRRNIEQSQVGGEDLVGLPWYSFEIKRVERVDLDKWWKQTCVQAMRKPPLASMALAQRFGGWKSLAAEVGAGASGEVVGSVPGAGCEAAGAGRLEVGLAGSRKAAVEAVAGPGLVGGPAWARSMLDEAGRGMDGQCLQVESLPKSGLPLPLWATAKGLGLNGGPIGSLALGGGPLPIPCVGGSSEAQGNPVSRPVEARSSLVATLDAPKGPNASNPLPMTREGVLIWRQNAKPWQVRFLGTLVAHNGLKLASVVDASLEAWLRLFRADLEVRIRG